MKAIAQITCVALVYLAPGGETAQAQQADTGCRSEPGPGTAQTLRCSNGVIIVAEDGANFTLQSRDANVSSVDLKSKALLLDAPTPSGRSRFRTTTPQAIAAVRGTKWAVDVHGTRTSVLALKGQVAVRRPGGPRPVVLGPGEGVDVDAGTDPLAIKRWARSRIDALLARLGQ
jgi:hypothetical protein